MDFKDVVKDTIKVGGCMSALVISGGLVALKAYRRGYLDAYAQATALVDNTIEREIKRAIEEEE